MEWQEFARKWLTAEIMLVRLVKPPMRLVDVKETGLPSALQDWALAQIAKVEFSSAQVPADFGAQMLNWWKGLNVGQKDVSDIFKYLWCRMAGQDSLCWFLECIGGG